MPYQIDEAKNNLNIPEREWGAGVEVKFSNFTSCIGILAKNTAGTSCVGIHLAIYDTDSQMFAKTDVPTVMKVLLAHDYDNNSVVIVGEISTWKNSESKDLQEAYKTLVAALGPRVTQHDDETPGSYDGKISNKKLVWNFTPSKKKAARAKTKN